MNMKSGFADTNCRARRKTRARASLYGLAVLCTGCLGARSATINFDTFPDGSPVPNHAVISTQYASLGVIFSSPNSNGAPTASVGVGEASSPPNGLWGLDEFSSVGSILPIEMNFTACFPTNVQVTLLSVG